MSGTSSFKILVCLSECYSPLELSELKVSKAHSPKHTSFPQGIWSLCIFDVIQLIYKYEMGSIKHYVETRFVRDALFHRRMLNAFWPHLGHDQSTKSRSV